MFGLDLMDKKTFAYTMLAKIGCLLSGTALYAVSLPIWQYKRKVGPHTRDSRDVVSRKFVAGQIRHVQPPLIHAHSCGLRRCHPDGKFRLFQSLRLCSLEYHLLDYVTQYLL